MIELYDQFQKSVDQILGFELWGNSGLAYFNALIISLILFACIKLVKSILLLKFDAWAAKTTTKIDDHIVTILKGISNFSLTWFSLFVVARFFLVTSDDIMKIIEGIFIVLIIYESVKLISKVVTYSFEDKIHGDPTTLNAILVIIKIVLWTIGLLLVLSNLGFNVTTLAASLGVGGIAVALAAQTVLGDMFASFSIFFDKPFRIGDFIVVGTDQGTVKKIGLKTTRIETIQGEELIISNSELTTARVQNLKRMKQRRVDFTLGLVYGTPVTKIQEAKDLIQEIIDADERTEFMRAHFVAFGDFSLKITVTYKVHNNDIVEYLDTQDTINFKIAEAFEKAKIEMAFPTQTIHLVK